MNTLATQIIEAIGPDVLEQVGATDIKDYDDIDTPGVQFDIEVNARNYRALITLQPTGAFKVYVYDPRTMETKRDEPDVDLGHLAEAINTLEVTL